MLQSDPRLLQLDPQDNVVVALQTLHAGETIQIGGQAVTLMADIVMPHKLACRAIRSGDKIRKYGVSIGSATQPIDVGAHVHVHNMCSDYTPTHHLEDAKKKSGGLA